MTNYYTFKLNLEPNILTAHNYDSQKNHVIGKVIPSALKTIFKENKEVDDEKLLFSDYIDINEVKESVEYSTMLKINEKMIEMYHEVVEKYKNGEGISYSPKYLDQRDLLHSSLVSLVTKYPFLESAYDLKKNIFQVDQFSKIKMSVTYIQKSKKIEYYLNNFQVTDLVSYFIYDTAYEYIYIPADDKTPKDAINYIELLEDKVNNFSHRTSIGHVSINPIYEEVIFEGLHSEITIQLVYPNGDPARDRSKAIESAQAAKEKTTFEASKNSKIDAESLSDFYKNYAEKGYIKSVTSRGKNIIKSIIKTVKI